MDALDELVELEVVVLVVEDWVLVDVLALDELLVDEDWEVDVDELEVEVV